MNWNKKPDAFYRKANSNSKTIISNGWKRRSTSGKLCLNVDFASTLPQKENSIFHDCILGDRRWGWSRHQKKDVQLSHNTCLCPPHP
jgi:hypothetical protein